MELCAHGFCLAEGFTGLAGTRRPAQRGTDLGRNLPPLLLRLETDMSGPVERPDNCGRWVQQVLRRDGLAVGLGAWAGGDYRQADDVAAIYFCLCSYTFTLHIHFAQVGDYPTNFFHGVIPRRCLNFRNKIWIDPQGAGNTFGRMVLKTVILK